MLEVSDGDPVAAWRAVLLAQHHAIRAIEADLAASRQVSLTVYDVLLELHDAPGSCLRMQELSERVVLSRSRVSRLVDELERDGLVERRPDPLDGRATRACLTAAGRKAFRSAAPVYRQGIERHFTSQLTAAEQRTITASLQKVIDHHDRAQLGGAGLRGAASAGARGGE